MPAVEPLNTIPLQQFISTVKSAENSRAKEIKIDIATAKKLAFTLGIVMSRVHGELEQLVADSKNTSDEIINITMDGKF